MSGVVPGEKLSKVLIVEDEQSLAELLALVVEELGHTALQAANGKEALRLIQQEQPELVLSDVMMPVLDGYELVRQLKLQPRWQQVKVVLISAAPIDKRRLPSADAYLAKPYNLSEMEALITRLTT